MEEEVAPVLSASADTTIVCKGKGKLDGDDQCGSSMSISEQGYLSVSLAKRLKRTHLLRKCITVVLGEKVWLTLNKYKIYYAWYICFTNLLKNTFFTDDQNSKNTQIPKPLQIQELIILISRRSYVPYHSGGCDKQVKMWPLGGGQPETDAIHDMPVYQVAWISKTNMLDSEKWDKILRRLETGFKSAGLSMWLKTGFQTREYCLLGILCQVNSTVGWIEYENVSKAIGKRCIDQTRAIKVKGNHVVALKVLFKRQLNTVSARAILCSLSASRVV
ncbi:Protein RAE1 [Artemisia annua]|uniref:Protein RAE1 n=1 Tax=Artemisia annua TaxID=35608 RepID=A0A2U1QCC1_ARTAN|nr:Protein RAE1 [Artemisia annua]